MVDIGAHAKPEIGYGGFVRRMTSSGKQAAFTPLPQKVLIWSLENTYIRLLPPVSYNIGVPAKAGISGNSVKRRSVVRGATHFVIA
jgi:hypothetical protein